MPDVDYEKMFESIAERFKPGGIVEAGQLADIEAGKRRAIGTGIQQLVGSGLATTTVAGGVPIAAEEVAGRARLGVRGKTAEQLSTLELAMASLLEKARLSEATLTQQQRIASGQLGLGYAGLAQQERERTTGLDVFGRPMAGTQAYADMMRGGVGAGAGAGGDYAPTGGGYPSPYRPSTGGAGGYGTGAPQVDSTVGQQIIGGPAAGGMYLGEGRTLSPEQVEWGAPGSTAEAVGRTSIGAAAGAGGGYTYIMPSGERMPQSAYLAQLRQPGGIGGVSRYRS